LEGLKARRDHEIKGAVRQQMMAGGDDAAFTRERKHACAMCQKRFVSIIFQAYDRRADGWLTFFRGRFDRPSTLKKVMINIWSVVGGLLIHNVFLSALVIRRYWTLPDNFCINSTHCESAAYIPHRCIQSCHNLCPTCPQILDSMHPTLYICSQQRVFSCSRITVLRNMVLSG
jgi:hypothetical protein